MARNVTPKSEDALVILLASGATIPEASEGSGYCERTISRRLKDDTFLARIEAARQLFTKRALDRLLSLRFKHIENIDRISQADVRIPEIPNDASARELKKIIARRAILLASMESGTVRLNASKNIIELGSKLLVEHEFEQRLRAIEQRLEAQAHGTPLPTKGGGH